MDIVKLYCEVDDFCQHFIPAWNKQLISKGKKMRLRKCRLSVSEIMTLLIMFHYSHCRNFKAYYLGYVRNFLTREFPQLLSYQRFVRISPTVLVPLCAFLKNNRKDMDGLGFVDSSSISVCHNKRIRSHKVFAETAQLGKTTKGWFYGFKLHLICNYKGDIVTCYITPGNIDDRKALHKMVGNTTGTLYGDKGYISQQLFDYLFENGLTLVTSLRGNMKNRLISLFHKIMLKKRAMIESIFNQLKNVFLLEHSRHRSLSGGFINIITALIAYVIYPNKPSISLYAKELVLLKQLNNAF